MIKILPKIPLGLAFVRFSFVADIIRTSKAISLSLPTGFTLRSSKARSNCTCIVTQISDFIEENRPSRSSHKITRLIVHSSVKAPFTCPKIHWLPNLGDRPTIDGNKRRLPYDCSEHESNGLCTLYRNHFLR